MSDSELLKVLPQFLGISFALLLFTLLQDDIRFLYGALCVLFLLILRVRFLYIFGTVLHTLLKVFGSTLVNGILGTLYLTIITLYAFLFRILNKDSVQKFTYTTQKKSSYTRIEQPFTKSDFEKLW